METENIATSNKKCLNILLLGESGVGKSTWINGFKNYVTFKTFEEAKTAVFNPIVPVRFSIADALCQEQLISIGDDENENYQVGQSSTQFPKSHLIKYEDTDICLIDTPGIGGTRGKDTDTINFENIIQHISQVDRLHGLLVFLKPNNARLTSSFKYCFIDILKRLPIKSYTNIISFCFTHTRSTFYEPGDTLTSVREMLQETREINLDLSPKHIYSFDNEAIRFFAALDKGIIYSKREEQSFAVSWNKSRLATLRMIQTFESVESEHKKNETDQEMPNKEDKNKSSMAKVENKNISQISEQSENNSNSITAEDEIKQWRASDENQIGIGSPIEEINQLADRNCNDTDTPSNESTQQKRPNHDNIYKKKPLKENNKYESTIDEKSEVETYCEEQYQLKAADETKNDKEPHSRKCNTFQADVTNETGREIPNEKDKKCHAITKLTTVRDIDGANENQVSDASKPSTKENGKTKQSQLRHDICVDTEKPTDASEQFKQYAESKICSNKLTVENEETEKKEDSEKTSGTKKGNDQISQCKSTDKKEEMHNCPTSQQHETTYL